MKTLRPWPQHMRGSRIRSLDIAVVRFAIGPIMRNAVCHHPTTVWLMADDIGPASATAVLYMGNGLYFSAMWEYGLASSGDERETDMEELLSADTPLRVNPAAGDGACCRGGTSAPKPLLNSSADDWTSKCRSAREPASNPS